ncbi:Transglutaminase-like superfamily protein [Candidatus Burarchaeum australiense]|nr:Transglutaminase-like superfamily protein [Candidatus Burarchaeum australiense]
MDRKYALALALLALMSVSLADTGYMRAIVEKDWRISVNDSSIENIALDGFFLANNSNQRVLTLETNGQPDAEGELIKIKYSADKPRNTTVRARALVEVQYQSSFPQDGQVPFMPMDAYGASNFTPEIKSKAYELSSASSLETIALLTDWVHKNVVYNISYFGKSLPASEVFVKRQGVCTEYSHLLIAMLSSVGLQSRFVSGYVYQNGSFQPHAWVEVFVGNETIAADPTFGEAGALSANHVAMFYSSELISSSKMDLFFGENQSAAFDLVNARGGSGFDLSVNVSMEPQEARPFGRLAGMNYTYDNSTGELTVGVFNPTEGYELLSYSFNAPTEAYGSEERIVVVAPRQSLRIPYPLNRSSIEDGYLYTMPFVAGVQGTVLSSSVQYSLRNEEAQAPAPACPGAPVAFALLGLSIMLAQARTGKARA